MLLVLHPSNGGNKINTKRKQTNKTLILFIGLLIRDVFCERTNVGYVIIKITSLIRTKANHKIISKLILNYIDVTREIRSKNNKKKD